MLWIDSRPFTGAWIETILGIEGVIAHEYFVAPSRGRGLKQSRLTVKI